MGLIKRTHAVFLLGLLLQIQDGFAQSVAQEIRPYLVLNQYKYIPGDTLWFKAYLLHENLTRAAGKYRVHIDLVNYLGSSEFHALVILNDGIGQNQIPLSEEIEPGTYLVTAYLDGQELDEGLFIFKREIIVASPEVKLSSEALVNTSEPENLDVQLELSQSPAHPREKISIHVSVKDVSGSPVDGEFSVSIVKRELLVEKPSEFRKDLNMLFNDSTHNQRLFAKSSNSRERQAQVFFNDSDKPLPDSASLYVYLQNSRWRYQTIIGKNGWIKLSLPDLFFQDEFFFLAEIDGIITDDIQVKWERPNIVLPRARVPERITGVDDYAIYASKKRITDQSFDFYSLVSNKTVRVNDEIVKKEILPIAITINTQDYELFPSMSEYIKEIVPTIYLRRRNGKEVVRVKLQSPGSNRAPVSATADPVYIVDGIATKNTDFFLSLKPADIISIKIANDPRKLASWGLFGKNGVLIVQTKKGNTREPQLDLDKIFDGLSPIVPFRTKSHEGTGDLRRPDFRSNLYWNPIVQMDQNGRAAFEFFTSDDIGEFEITIEGIAMNGKPFSTQKSFWVKP